MYPSDMKQLFRLQGLPGINALKSWGRLGMILLATALLAACASPITAKVTSFNQWPADAAGATFSFIRPADNLNDLEQQAYEATSRFSSKKSGSNAQQKDK